MAKKDWMKIHTYLSLFFLPMCFIYVLTGIGYIFEFKDSAGAKIYEFVLPNPPQKGEEAAVMIETLKANNLKIPSNTEITMQRGNPTMGTISYGVSIESDRKSGELKVRVIDRSLYGILVLMHKAKGAVYFDIVAVGFALSLAIFYLSGLIMTSFCKNKRKSAGIAFGSGLLITIIAVYLSAF